MNERSSSNSDWSRLVAKTYKRPLMWRPGVFSKRNGTLLRPQWSDRLVAIGVGIGLGVPVIWAAFQPDVILKPLLYVVGPLLLWIAGSQLLRTTTLFVPNDSEDVIVRYGFILFPTRLVLPRQQLVVEYCAGAETNLHKSLRSFKHILLRHLGTDDVAHLAFTLVSDDALRIFDALSALLGGSHNYTEAVVTLHDGLMVRVNRLATWEAGKWRCYENQLTPTDSKTIEITRRTFGENRHVVNNAGDVYPIQIEVQRDTVCIRYSNHAERTIPDYECFAIQVCKEEIAQRRTRYEVNLITDSSKTERLNLLSYDIAPDAAVDDVWAAANSVGVLLDLEVFSHL